MRAIKILVLLFPLAVFGHGENPTIAKGHATIEYPDPKTQLIQADDKTVINFTKFNLARDETTRVALPGKKASLLCRVTGNNASIIEGRLLANGRLYFINPHGIFFSETAQMTVGTLVASTLDIKDDDFIQDKYRFVMDSAAQDSAIVNRSQIAAEGAVVFMASEIVNQGTIVAKAGRYALAGEIVTLDFEGDEKIAFAIEAPIKNSFILEEGQNSSNGWVRISSKTARQIIQNVVNMNGLEEAVVIRKENGIARLLSSAAQNDGVQEEMKPVKFKTDNIMEAPEGTIIINNSMGDEKNPLGKVMARAKTIDYNASSKAAGPINFQADRIDLEGDLTVLQQNLNLDGPVIVTNNLNLKAGKTKGDIRFNSTIDANQPYSVSIITPSDPGRIVFEGPIGSRSPLGDLTISTKEDLLLNNIGAGHAGARRLKIEASKVECQGDLYHASEQEWDAKEIFMESPLPTTFITDQCPLIFKSSKLQLKEHNLSFQTQGGALSFPAMDGVKKCSITADAGKGHVTLGQIRADLGELYVQGHDIHLQGEVKVQAVTMKALNHISTAPKVKITTSGNTILNAEQGMIGSDQAPVHVQTEGALFLGAKSLAYVKGDCSHHTPYRLPENPPYEIVFNSIAMKYATPSSKHLFEDFTGSSQQKINSLTPDLLHRISLSYTKGTYLLPRRSSIYYQVQPIFHGIVSQTTEDE